MKTFLKLIMVFAAFGFAIAKAAPTTTAAQKEAASKATAIKAVTDAVKSGDQEAIKAALNNQIALYPRFAADIVTAALTVTAISGDIQKLIVRVAAFTAPNQIVSINQAIDGIFGTQDKFGTVLKNLASSSAANGQAILTAASGGGTTIKGLVSFN